MAWTISGNGSTGAILAEKITDPEAMVEHYLSNGQKDKAFELLYKLAVYSAKKKEFTRSEEFRDRLYEVDSSALSPIIEVNEIIEAEKNKAVTPDLRRIWSRFFQELPPNEANTLFLALKKQTIESETELLQQGLMNDNLYFIDNGQVKLLYRDSEKELFIQKLGSGDVFGEDTFFSVNVCTFSVKTMTRVQLGILDRATFKKLKNTQGLQESKLRKICGSGRSIFNHLRQKGIDRRAFKRINLHVKVAFQLLSSDTTKAMQRSVTAELWDISKGGLSIYFQSKNREAVRHLIGRNVGVRFSLPVEGQNRSIALTGVVHGVQNHPLDEYSVHLQFNRKLSDEAIKTIQYIADRT
jgi:CRP-like cAMP-binding protein